MRAPAHRQVDAVFDALADPTRRRVVETLARGGTVTASGLAEQLPITRQAIAKHLTLLSEAGLVTAEHGERRRVRYRLRSAPMQVAELVSASRIGRETHYKLRPQPLDDAAHWIQMVSAEWDDRLEALRRSLAKRQTRS